MSTTATETINWRNLIVTNPDGVEANLGFIVDTDKSMLSGCIVRGGEIAEWHGYFLSAPGETADWNTPNVPVDWTGFAKYVVFNNVQVFGDGSMKVA